MARTHGKNSDFSYNAVAIEDELSEITQSIDVPAADITAFADAYQNRLAGKKSVRTELTGSLDLAASQGIKTLLAGMGGGPLSTIFEPDGTTAVGTGNPYYKCTASGLTGALVASLRIRFPVGGAANYQATLQHSGSTTRATA